MSNFSEERFPEYENPGTTILDMRDILRRRRVSLRDVWDRHWDEISQTFDQGQGTGYALVVFDAFGNARVMASFSEPNGDVPRTVTIGRHTHCALCVTDDPSVALRHLTLALAPGSRSLEVIDLRTEDGFVIDTVGPARSALVDGAVSVSFASMRLIALPMDPEQTWLLSPDEAWERFFNMPPVRVAIELLKNPTAIREGSADRASRGTGVSLILPVLRMAEVENAAFSSREAEGLKVHSKVGAVEAGSSLWPRATNDSGEIEATLGEVQNAADFDDIDGPIALSDSVALIDGSQHHSEPTARLTLTGPHGRVAMTVTDQELERGILLGRYERCAGLVFETEYSRHARHVFGMNVSRVHALVKRDGDGRVVIIDTGSTFGLYVKHRRVVCAELGSGEAAMLGGLDSLRYDELQ